MQPSPRRALGVMLAGVVAAATLGGVLVARVVTQGPLLAAAGWFHLDALGAYNLAVMLLVNSLSSLYAWVYFSEEIASRKLALGRARMFAGLWCAALTAMILVFLSNSLGIMWVGIEATTLLTAFLICVHVSRPALEAMWKYILICAVGVAFAFMGTLLIAAAGHGLAPGTARLLLWTELHRYAGSLDPMFAKAAFIFLLVGYGTKAGLAPMHNWLPDAHSQAPAPVSAMFSGSMLSTALYCIMRYVPIVEAATGRVGWSLELLVVIGLLSIVIAAAFILSQHDLKRLLAYSSVEHLGIIALGFGLGGLGAPAALFHTLNHGLCKTLAFCAAGRLGQAAGTHDLGRLSGVMRQAPLWGAGLFAALLALIGLAPFALFMSELQILKAALDGRWTGAAVLFLVASAVVFAGILRHLIPLAWGAAPAPCRALRTGWLEAGLVAVPLSLLLVLGLWMPAPLGHMLAAAAAVVGDAGSPVAAASAGLSP
ncbi:MAG: proton-conducting transporter membrane subunit [Gemmatimonadota bacterium]